MIRKQQPKSKLVSSNKDKPEKIERYGRDIGLQLSGRELLMRYGTTKGSQLGKENASFCQVISVVPPKLEKVEIEVLDMAIFESMLRNNVYDFQSLPPETHGVLKSMQVTSRLFLNEKQLKMNASNQVAPLANDKSVDADLMELDECIKDLQANPKLNKDKDMKEAITILKKHRKDRTGMSTADLTTVSNAFNKAIGVDLDDEEFEKLTLGLQNQGYLDAQTSMKLESMHHNGQCSTMTDVFKEINKNVKEVEGRPSSIFMVPKTYEEMKLEATICDCIPKNTGMKGMSKESQDGVDMMSKIDMVFLTPENAPKLIHGKRASPSKTKEALQLKLELQQIAMLDKSTQRSTIAKEMATGTTDGIEMADLATGMYDIGKDIVISTDLLEGTIYNLAARSIITKKEAEQMLARLRKSKGGCTVGGIRRAIQIKLNEDNQIGTEGALMTKREKRSDMATLKCVGDVLTAVSRHPPTRDRLNEHQRLCLYAAGYLGNLHNANALAGEKRKLTGVQEAKFFKEQTFEEICKKLSADPCVEPKGEKAKVIKTINQRWTDRKPMSTEELASAYDVLARNITVKPNHVREILGFMKDNKMIAPEQMTEVEGKYRNEVSAASLAEDLVDTGILPPSGAQAPPPSAAPVPAASRPKKNFFQDDPGSDWKYNRMTAEKARALGAGGMVQERQHFIVDREEHAAVQMLQVFAAQCFELEPIDVGPGGVAHSAASESELKTTMDSYRSFRSQKSCLTSMAATTRSTRSVRNLEPQTKLKYQKLIKSVREMPNYDKDVEKKDALGLLEAAVNENRGLSFDELQMVMDAIGKNTMVPQHILQHIVDRLAQTQKLTQQESKQILIELNEKVSKGLISVAAIQGVLSYYGDKKNIESAMHQRTVSYYNADSLAPSTVHTNHALNTKTNGTNASVPSFCNSTTDNTKNKKPIPIHNSKFSNFKR